MKANAFILCFSLLLVSGCATNKPINVSDGKVIAVSLNVNESVKRHHTGFTVFGNENEEVDVPWGGAQFIRTELLSYVTSTNTVRFVDGVSDNEAYAISLPSPKSNRVRQEKQSGIEKLGGDAQYLLHIKSGNLCLDPYCNSGVAQPLIYSTGGRAEIAISLAWSVIEVSTSSELFHRNFVASIPLDKDALASRKSSNADFKSALQCMVREVVRAGTAEMKEEPVVFLKRGIANQSSTSQVTLDVPSCAMHLGHLAETAKAP